MNLVHIISLMQAKIHCILCRRGKFFLGICLTDESPCAGKERDGYGRDAGLSCLSALRGVPRRRTGHASGVACFAGRSAGAEGRAALRRAAHIRHPAAGLGAKGLFLDVSPDAPSAAAVKALRAFGLTVYAPFCDGGVIPTYADPVDPQTEAPFALALTWRAAQTELGGHEAVKRSIGPAELRALIRDHAPQTAFSRELLANYCTLHAGGKTLFLLFDSEETMQMRLTRAQDSGACACFLAGSP